MSARALLSEALAAGLHLEIEGLNIAVTPASKLTAGLRARIAAEKPALLELLRAPIGPFAADPRRCAGCGRDGFVLMLVTYCRDQLCRACWRATTKASDVHQPPTPTLDRLMRLADERAGRERA